ncbi:hypothetical protein M413DRAFT_16043 [Hebeloma cylindrosporum]|uniref:protein-tyrosine-phosphatase n=1 Tax=Hebeloma cylindrosporum TaxID=76867 RepID=A0A0C3CGW6_HEBCY|nr:hypothetical protein M413DRAFT_16043 [Hebeloma cylindrosporum h7]
MALATAFHAIPPAALPDWLADPAALILDIRPHAAFSSARIPRAISLSVPSTLLKRPLFSLQRLSAMLPSAASRARFSAWRTASRIVVYDADSLSAGESSNIHGLLRKFKSDGFDGELAWLQGGFQAVWRDRRDLVDTNPPTPEVDDEDEVASTLKTRHLPMAAFSLSSTTVHNSSHFNPPPKRPFSLSSQPLPTASSSHPAFNPFFDAVRQNTELSQGITERIPLRLPRRVRRRIHQLPFPWLQAIARRAANSPRRHALTDSSSSESEDDDSANPADIEEGKEALAMQFFKIELSEQRRLMGIMEHHSRESGQASGHPSFPAVPFPFSITAGVEKGAKNRYRHIWPFEHARVRLHQNNQADDDYVNASYIQPLGTTRRYIATQGPLPATFTDFWTLCWEQNVHVIVMLTREVEGAMLISTEGLVPADERPSTAGFFGNHSLSPHSSRSPRRFPHSAGSQRHYQHHHFHSKRSETVKRVFELSHTKFPEAKPRRIVHLQYLEWPDLNVPDDPRGVLGLIKQVDEAVRESQVDGQGDKLRYTKSIPLNEVDPKTGVAKHALANSPVLLHCSAGVGRTGGFIAVDAVLDAIRRELRANARHVSTNPGDMSMDVDLKNTGGTHTMSAGGEHVPGAHVLVATPMQANARTVEGKSTKLASGTFQWAKRVSDETGINGVGPNIQGEPLSSSPPVSISATGSYSKGVSSERNQHNGSYYYNSSSSLGTSVSGTSSSSPKANIESTNPPQHSELPRSDGQRSSTISAPSRTAHASPSTPCLPVTPPFVNAPQTSSSQSFPEMNIEDESGICTDDSEIHTSSRVGGAVNMFPAFNPGGLSSDGEPPSRSQSPSADESSHVHPPVPPQLPRPMPVPTLSPLPTMGLSLNDQPTKSFDYKEPRPLNEDFTPPLLTSFDDPIWEVVQDMREQRMSLCQSLRQYVFVHAAIIEGALMVLDEEKEFADGLMPRNVFTSPCTSCLRERRSFHLICDFYWQKGGEPNRTFEGG